jgi:hypothetical protein
MQSSLSGGLLENIYLQMPRVYSVCVCVCVCVPSAVCSSNKYSLNTFLLSTWYEQNTHSKYVSIYYTPVLQRKTKVILVYFRGETGKNRSIKKYVFFKKFSKPEAVAHTHNLIYLRKR